jgi:hypothetical protein
VSALFAIPTDATMPEGLSAAEQMIWRALRDYGAYYADRPLRAGKAPTADLAKINSQLRWVTRVTSAALPVGDEHTGDAK